MLINLTILQVEEEVEEEAEEEEVMFLINFD